MKFERSPWEKLNRILTAVAVLYLGVWLWKWLGPESSGVRKGGALRAWDAGFTLTELFWVGVAVACLGYLLWRFLGWLFWRKYFGSSPPPDEPM